MMANLRDMEIGRRPPRSRRELMAINIWSVIDTHVCCKARYDVQYRHVR